MIGRGIATRIALAALIGAVSVTGGRLSVGRIGVGNIGVGAVGNRGVRLDVGGAAGGIRLLDPLIARGCGDVGLFVLLGRPLVGHVLTYFLKTVWVVRR